MLRADERVVVETQTGDTHICLIFPERYEVGISNLGFHQVYRLAAAHPDVNCERGFRDPAFTATSFETGRPLGSFDMLAFALPFELNYIGMLTVLDQSGIPMRARHRNREHPLVIAGGVAASANPEPIAEFVDAVVIGDAEPVLDRLFCTLAEHKASSRAALLDSLTSIPGIYVPSRYEPTYDSRGELSGYRPETGAPAPVTRVATPPCHAAVPARSAILTNHTEFSGAFLVELARGCPRKCRFCLASAISPCRFFSGTRVIESVPEHGIARKVGLVGAAVSDHPELDSVVSSLADAGHFIALSSVRPDMVSDTMLTDLARSGQRTVTFAPETGSERLGRCIGKQFQPGVVEDAAVRAIKAGLRNIKLYFMIGLPEETDDDVTALIDLVRRVAQEMRALQSAGSRVGSLRTAVNFFVPKGLTAFEDVPMVPASALRSKMARIVRALRREPLVTVRNPSLRWAHVQAALSRGDRRGAELLESIVRDGVSPASAVRRWADTVPCPAIEGFTEQKFRPWELVAYPAGPAKPSST